MNSDEKNYLINTFMGLVFYDDEDSWYDPVEGVFVLPPRYHDDWNDLMGCVEKIEKMDTLDKRVYIEIKGGEVFIGAAVADEEYLFLYQENGYDDNGSKIGAVYEAVVAFIIWYNQNKQS